MVRNRNLPGGGDGRSRELGRLGERWTGYIGLKSGEFGVECTFLKML
jgi:hypothetical protein